MNTPKDLRPILRGLLLGTLTTLLSLSASANNGGGTGLRGDYYSNTSLKGAVALSRTDATVNFQWGASGPVSSARPDKYSARWSGQVEAPVTGAFTFHTRADDGVRLWVDGRLLINHWSDHSPMFDQSVPVNLTAGRRYNIQLEFYENTGGAVMQLFWSYPNQAQQIIPQQRLFPAAVAVQPEPAATSRVWLSDMNWLSSTNGWGPNERNRSNGETGAADGKVLLIGGRRYSYGIGVHAESEIRIALDDRYDMFKAVVGVDDEVGNRGSVIFEVWLDGRRAFQSPVMRGNMPGLAIEVPVENARELKLRVTSAGDNKTHDHADWGDARFEGVEQVKFLSDMNWVSATNGSGPVERDRANGGSAARDGQRIKLRGQTYMKGLGTRANAEIKYDIDKKYELFSAVVGIDDAARGSGSAIFEVWSGGTRLYRSDKLRGSGGVQHISVLVKDREMLTLKTLDGDDGSANDLADWADAKLLPINTDAPSGGGSSAGAPAAPANLTATGGNGQVSLAWQASAGATGYHVYRGLASGGDITAVAMSLPSTNFVDTGVTNGAAYRYKVRALNAAGASGYSNIVTVTPGGGGTPPPPPPPPGPTSGPATAPANVTATPGNAQATLAWSAVTGATSYRVLRSTTSNGQSSTPVATVTGTSFNNSGLTNGTTYYYKIAAQNAGGIGPSSGEVSVTPQMVPSAPTGLTATAGNAQVTLNWTAVAGATSYRVFRGTTSNGQAAMPVASPTTNSLTDTGLANGTTYYYKVSAVNGAGTGPNSSEANATPLALPVAPTGVAATAGNARVTLNWAAVTGATSYSVLRGTTSNGQATTPVGTATTTSYTNTGLTNGTTYFYKIAAVNAAGAGPSSSEVSATPLGAPLAPAGLTGTPGNAVVTLNWTATATAATYNVYRGTAANAQATAPVGTNLATPTFADTGLTNGTTYFYKVTALNAGGESPRSTEVSATPVAPPPVADPTNISALRLLRQATWGPKPGDIDHVKQVGVTGFLNEQFTAPVSVYPDTLVDIGVEGIQEHFMQLALTGTDQLRQRVAWALHKIWVVSAVELNDPRAILHYKRTILGRAFGNYRDLMRDITLNPAMGRYLNMLNNRSQQFTGVLPNENYARELLQLFTMGIPTLNQNGTPVLNMGAQVPAYTEEDVKELARIFTGWTFGDGNPATVPNNSGSENFRFPMEAVQRFHDTGAKTFLGANFIPNQTAVQDLDQALDVIFNHPNVAVFVSRQLIQQLVTSNPSQTFISDIAGVFANNGSNVRGDLAAVVRAILTHPEAGLGTPSAGKLMEPALYVISQLRSLNAQVTDTPFMSNMSEEMGQKVFFPNSVFSYFSPGFRIRGGTMAAPEFQILTSVTSLSRTNFIAHLLSGEFGSNVTVDYTPFTSRAANPAALVDYCNLLFMGGLMSDEQRNEIIAAVSVSPATSTTERMRTALYLTLTSLQYQVDH